MLPSPISVQHIEQAGPLLLIGAAGIFSLAVAARQAATPEMKGPGPSQVLAIANCTLLDSLAGRPKTQLRVLDTRL